MFINAVILVLQEVVEITLLIGLLLVLCNLGGLTRYWIAIGCVPGFVFAMLYARHLAQVSAWLDGSGQEVLNAVIEGSTLLCLTFFTFALVRRGSPGGGARGAAAIMLPAAITSALVITREGSEVLIYLSGFLAQPMLSAVLTGGCIGGGIGLSTGVLLYYSLLVIAPRWGVRIALGLLCLVGGSMASHATLLLMQADWLPSTAPLWDSSQLIDETSISGHLLYALIGYEATPSLYFVLAYCLGALLIAGSLLMARAQGKVGNGGRVVAG